MAKLSIFGVNLRPITREELQTPLDGSDRFFISKINANFLQRTLKDSDFRNTLNASTFTLVDGHGVQWAARYITLPISSNRFLRPFQAVWQMVYSGAAIVFDPKFITIPITECIPGIEALEIMLGAAEQSRSGVFFFGSPQKVLEIAIENLKQRFPKLKVSGFLNGYDFQKDESIDPVKVINATDAKLLIVSLGSPKQEYWIDENLSKLKNVRIAVGEGGTLDRIAAPKEQTPKWLNRLGLEWLWRLFFNKSQTETRNRFQRFWYSVPVFIYEVVKWKIENGPNEAK